MEHSKTPLQGLEEIPEGDDVDLSPTPAPETLPNANPLEGFCLRSILTLLHEEFAQSKTVSGLKKLLSWPQGVRWILFALATLDSKEFPLTHNKVLFFEIIKEFKDEKEWSTGIEEGLKLIGDCLVNIAVINNKNLNVPFTKEKRPDLKHETSNLAILAILKGYVSIASEFKELMRKNPDYALLFYDFLGKASTRYKPYAPINTVATKFCHLDNIEGLESLANLVLGDEEPESTFINALGNFSISLETMPSSNVPTRIQEPFHRPRPEGFLGRYIIQAEERKDTLKKEQEDEINLLIEKLRSARSSSTTSNQTTADVDPNKTPIMTFHL